MRLTLHGVRHQELKPATTVTKVDLVIPLDPGGGGSSIDECQVSALAMRDRVAEKYLSVASVPCASVSCLTIAG